MIRIDPRISRAFFRATGTTLSANRRLRDDAVRHAIVLERYKRHEVDAVGAFIDRQVLPKVVNMVNMAFARGREWTAKHYAELLVNLNSQLRASMSIVGDRVQETMKNFALTEAEWAVASLTRAVPLEIVFASVSPDLLVSAVARNPLKGRMLKSWFDGIAQGSANAIVKHIRQGIVVGESTDKIVRKILGDRASQGAFEGTARSVKSDAQAVVRTAINETSATAKERVYAANTDVIGFVQIVATLDERTTDICKAQDGKVYPVNSGPRPPFHFNCRTTTVPITRSWKELKAHATSKADMVALGKLTDTPAGARASMQGEVPGTQTYETWLRTQPASFQDDVLGAGRAEIFRSGKLPLSRFVDYSGKRLNLAQLQEIVRSESPKPSTRNVRF